MIYVVHNIVAFGTSVIVLQALVNTFIAVRKHKKQETKQVSPREGTKRKHKVNNISLRQGALFVLPANSCAAKNLQWSQNVPVFELRVSYSRKTAKFSGKDYKRWSSTPLVFPWGFLQCGYLSHSTISNSCSPTTSTGRGSKQIELFRSNSSRLAEYLEIYIKSILGSWAEETPSPIFHVSPHPWLLFSLLVTSEVLSLELR